jgi:hypothetical protein
MGVFRNDAEESRSGSIIYSDMVGLVPAIYVFLAAAA